MPTIESVLLTAVSITTFEGDRNLTNASGFFFKRGKRLFLGTSGHVLSDKDSKHHPDRVVIEVHTDPVNMTQSTGFSIPLYRNRKSIWREGLDAAGEIDVAVIEIELSALPRTAVFCSFTPDHLLDAETQVEIGTQLLVVGFPLGFHDTLHHVPVVRHAIVASSFGMRFQGKGYFLTDARTHRGISGAPVVARRDKESSEPEEELPWMLLGVHSARLDVGSRDEALDEALGLNCAWYADILMTLTKG